MLVYVKPLGPDLSGWGNLYTQNSKCKCLQPSKSKGIRFELLSACFFQINCKLSFSFSPFYLLPSPNTLTFLSLIEFFTNVVDTSAFLTLSVLHLRSLQSPLPRNCRSTHWWRYGTYRVYGQRPESGPRLRAEDPQPKE